MCCIYNNEQYNSDTTRLINKFDIYICDLGDIGESNTLGKNRPCVIISNDKYNSPKNGQYLIAPIRTEHSMKVSAETLEHIVDVKKNVGRIYVPIEMRTNDFRFIDITQMRQIANDKIQSYVSTIINFNLRERINEEIFNLLFSEEESHLLVRHVESTFIPEEEPTYEEEKHGFFDKVSSNYEPEYTLEDLEEDEESPEEDNSSIEELKTEEDDSITKPKRKHTGGIPEKHLPNGFILHYKLLKQKRITMKQLAAKCDMSAPTLRRKIKEFEKMHPELV